jgi:membrane-associated protease RseP (regulator of RpoE activity)
MQIEPYAAAREREELRQIAAEVMDIESVEHVPPEERGAIRLAGQLRQEPQTAYDYIAPRFHEQGYTPLLQEAPEGAAVLALPGLLPAKKSRLWLALLLFGITVVSTIVVGAMGVGLLELGIAVALGVSLEGLNFDLGLGLAFSAALLSILLAHELGHFLMARRLGVTVSYPFFIPMPLTNIGTMGAFISMKEPPPDRRALLLIAVAGPLAGLVVAVPVLLLGLALSEVQTFASIAQDGPVPILMEGNSLLYAAAKIIVFGRFLPDGVEDVFLHPVAWAGWVGLLVTALNLMPAGQLDGGHIYYALFGPRIARLTTWGVVVVLLVLGLLQWQGWLIWAVLIFLLGQYRAPLLNEITPLDTRHRLLAILGLVVFVLVFTPVPLRQVIIGQ